LPIISLINAFSERWLHFIFTTMMIAKSSENNHDIYTNKLFDLGMTAAFRPEQEAAAIAPAAGSG